MFSGITIALVVALGLVALFVLTGSVRGRPPSRAELLATRVATGVLAVHALYGVVRALVDTPPALPLTEFLIYLVVSVLVVPFVQSFGTSETAAPESGAAGSRTAGSQTAEPNRWGGAVIAVGLIGSAVAVWRIQVLWDAGVAGA